MASAQCIQGRLGNAIPGGFFIVCHVAPLYRTLDCQPLNQSEDVFHAPGGRSWAEFYRFGETAILDALPLGRFTYRDNCRYRRFGFGVANDMGKA